MSDAATLRSCLQDEECGVIVIVLNIRSDTRQYNALFVDLRDFSYFLVSDLVISLTISVGNISRLKWMPAMVQIAVVGIPRNGSSRIRAPISVEHLESRLFKGSSFQTENSFYLESLWLDLQMCDLCTMVCSPARVIHSQSLWYWALRIIQAQCLCYPSIRTRTKDQKKMSSLFPTQVSSVAKIGEISMMNAF